MLRAFAHHLRHGAETQHHPGAGSPQQSFIHGYDALVARRGGLPHGGGLPHRGGDIARRGLALV